MVKPAPDWLFLWEGCEKKRVLLLYPPADAFSRRFSFFPRKIRSKDAKLKEIAEALKPFIKAQEADEKNLKALDDIANRYFDRYQRVAGEVESRNVQARLGMKLDERLKKPPFETEDVPREDQIVLWQSDQRQTQNNEDNLRIARPDLIPLSPEDQEKVDKQREEVRAKYDGTEEWLKAPNGKQSNLSEDLWVAVRTQLFKDWFGEWEKEPAPRSVPTSEERGLNDTSDLKQTTRVTQETNKDSTNSENVKCGLLVENGEPLLVYHGTPQRFKIFRRVGDGRHGIGFHFGAVDQAIDRISDDDLRVGGRYVIMNGGLYVGFLNIRNPLYIGEDFKSWNADMFARRILMADAEGKPFFQITEKDRERLIKAANRYTNQVDLVLQVLNAHGFDGVVYENEVEGEQKAKSYIALKAGQFKEANNLGTFSASSENMYYQSGQGAQGSITMRNFAECHDALITLFKNANASTLPHESAHWLLSAMRALNEMGVATEKMQQDIAAIDEWLNNQDYSADAVKKFARNAVGEDGTVNEAVARDEYFARAFEKYLKEGKFPENATNLLKRALQGLKRLLKSIYSDAITLEGIQMDKSITQFFDGIFAADYAVQETSKLYDILRSFNAETISMSKAEMADFEKALEAAKEDAESLAYLRALQAWNQGLGANSRKWRAEARAATVEKNVKRLPKARFMKVFSE